MCVCVCVCVCGWMGGWYCVMDRCRYKGINSCNWTFLNIRQIKSNAYVTPAQRSQLRGQRCKTPVMNENVNQPRCCVN